MAKKRARDGDLWGCYICGEMLHYERFYKQGANGRSSYCKKCHNAKSLENYGNNAKALKEEMRRRRLSYGYGITPEELSSMIDRQSGECAICDRPLDINRRDGFVVVDHDHTTLAIRGVLCKKCNFGLGLFNDSPALLIHAVAYLHEAHRRYIEERDSVRFVRRSR